jgi:hypothetical protein
MDWRPRENPLIRPRRKSGIADTLFKFNMNIPSDGATHNMFALGRQ